MFTEQDIKNAKQVEPLADITRVGARVIESVMPERRIPFFAPAAVIFTLMLIMAPKGTILETAMAAINYSKHLESQQTQSPNVSTSKQGNTTINANNSNVQNVQVINNGGQVSISSKK